MAVMGGPRVTARTTDGSAVIPLIEGHNARCASRWEKMKMKIGWMNCRLEAARRLFPFLFLQASPGES